jgi:ABC-2 type transport system ATP-binding protein
MQDIAELCERVILIDHGKLFFDGPLDAVLDRFATTKLLDVEFAAPCEADFARFGRVLERDGARVKLEVPRGQVAEVCRELLACGPVSDFSAQEIPIEEIIRQVFGEQQAIARR